MNVDRALQLARDVAIVLFVILAILGELNLS